MTPHSSSHRLSAGPHVKSTPKASVSVSSWKPALASPRLTPCPSTGHCTFSPVYIHLPSHRGRLLTRLCAEHLPPIPHSAEKTIRHPIGDTEAHRDLGLEQSCVSKAWICHASPLGCS